MHFGDRLKLLRERKGVSLRTAGKATDMSCQYLWSLEHSSNKRIPVPEKLRKLSRYYSVPVEDLLVSAGYLQDPMDPAEGRMFSYDKRVSMAFEHVINDPRFPRGEDLSSETTPFEAKVYIIELYQRVTGQKLL